MQGEVGLVGVQWERKPRRVGRLSREKAMESTLEEELLEFADDEGDQTSSGEERNYSFDSEDGSGSERKKRRQKVRRRRASQAKWKPYLKLSFEERMKADAKEASRANKLREAMAATGQPLAPYNTTQFLMNDHEEEYKEELNEELNLLPKTRHREASLSLSIDDEPEESNGFYYSSPDDEEEFVNKDFVKEFTSSSVERLGRMSNSELIMEIMEFHRRIEILEDQVGDMERGEIPMSRESAEKIMVIQREIALVSEDNVKIRDEMRTVVRQRFQMRQGVGVAVADFVDDDEVAGGEKSRGINNNSDSGIESNYADEQR